MSVDQVINDFFVGKILTLYKFEWIESKATKKHPDIWKYIWKTNQDLGKFNFNHLPGYNIHWPGTKWNKLNLDSMKIEQHKFKIKSVFIEEYEEWYKSADICFDLEGFEDQFHCSFYDELELSSQIQI